MANPPIVIGPFNNVPAPGSPIRSDWPQQITQYAVDSRTTINALIKQNGMVATVGILKTGTVDANGDILVNFGVTFKAKPTIVITSADIGQAWRFGVSPNFLYVDAAYVRCWRGDGSLAPAGNAVAFFWLASGEIA